MHNNTGAQTETSTFNNLSNSDIAESFTVTVAGTTTNTRITNTSTGATTWNTGSQYSFLGNLYGNSVSSTYNAQMGGSNNFNAPFSVLMPSPTGVTGTAGTGGTLAAGTYYYCVEASDGNTGDWTTCGNEIAKTVSASGSVTLTGFAVAQDQTNTYRVYRGTTAGGENVYYTVTGATTFTDTGATSTNGTPATTNTALIAAFGGTAAAGTTAFQLCKDGSVNSYTGTAPTIAAGAGAGTSPTVSVVTNSTNNRGGLSITTGTSPTASSTIATVTFATGQAPANVLFCQIYPTNVAAAALATTALPYRSSTPSTTSFAISSNGSALGASTAYTFGYSCQ